MGGSKTKTVDTTPQATQQVRAGLTNYIMDPSQGGIGRINAAPVTGPSSVTVGGVRDVAAPIGGFGSGPDLNRGMIRDVTGTNISSTNVSADKTQSVDQLGGANSAFFQNMMAQIAPAMAQARSEAVAAGREGAGTSTGSGFANRLAAGLNRSMGQQQMLAANYAAQGVGMEQQRQASDANRNLQAAGMNQSAALTAAQANQQNAMQAGMANQSQDANFINALLAKSAQGLQGQQMGLTANLANQQADLTRATTQAQLDQQRNLTQYQGNLTTANQNAGNFASLLGQQATAGVGPTTVQQSGGVGSFLGQAGGMLLGSALGPMGTALGGQLGGALFGGNKVAANAVRK